MKINIPGNKKINFTVSASLCASIIEWYDFHLFGSILPIIAKNFFPQDNPYLAIIFSLITFTIGLIVRPIGALFFGRMGDTIGRKNTFLFTLILMSGATTAIGLLPSYSEIGIFSTISLIIFRIIQGLAISGECGGALILVAEHVPKHKRGLYTGIIQSSGNLGLLTALSYNLLIQKIMGYEDFLRWGWRILFLSSLILVVVAYFMRRNLEEPPEFNHLHLVGETSANPIKESFFNPLNRKKIIAVIFGVMAAQGALVYSFEFSFFYFLEHIFHFEYYQAIKLQIIALIIVAPCIPLFGFLSDLWGRLTNVYIGTSLGLIFIVPIYKFLLQTSSAYFESYHQKHIVLIVLSLATLGIIAAALNGVVASLLVDLFPTRIRYTSLSFAYNVGNGVFGGLAPLLSLISTKNFHFYNNYGLIYLFVILSLSLITSLYCKNILKSF